MASMLQGVYTSSAVCPVCGGTSRFTRINPETQKEETYCQVCATLLSGSYVMPANKINYPTYTPAVELSTIYINLDMYENAQITYKGKTFNAKDIIEAVINILEGK